MAGMASNIHCLENKSKGSFACVIKSFFYNITFEESKKGPVGGFVSELTPQRFQVFILGCTKELDELQELQRGVLMYSLHVVCDQIIQGLQNLHSDEGASSNTVENNGF